MGIICGCCRPTVLDVSCIPQPIVQRTQTTAEHNHPITQSHTQSVRIIKSCTLERSVKHEDEFARYFSHVCLHKFNKLYGVFASCVMHSTLSLYVCACESESRHSNNSRDGKYNSTTLRNGSMWNKTKRHRVRQRERAATQTRKKLGSRMKSPD